MLVLIYREARLFHAKNCFIKTKEAKLKQADSFISLGEKFYWTPKILLFGYFFKLENISKFDLGLFFAVVMLSFVLIYISAKMNTKGLSLYEEVYNNHGCFILNLLVQSYSA